MKKESLFIIALTGLLLGGGCRSLSPEENCRYQSEAVDLQIYRLIVPMYRSR